MQKFAKIDWLLRMTETETLDLRGEKCPDTFVYTKIKLEEIVYNGGGTLKIIIDYLPAIESIPRSLMDEKIRYKLVGIKHGGGDEYELLIECPAL